MNCPCTQFIRGLFVGGKAMNKVFAKIAALVAGLSLVIGVGFTIATNRVIPNRADADTYILVKDVNDIASGDNIIIGNGRSGTVKLLSSTQNSNNRGATSGSAVVDEVIALPNDAEVITLGRSNDKWTLYANNSSTKGYLYAASSSNNYLRTRANDSDGNSRWNITITAEGVASITATGSNTRNQLKNNGSLFACYSSGQTAVSIYKKQDTTTYHYVSFNSLGNGTYDTRKIVEGEGAGELPTPTKAKDEVNQKRYVFLGWFALSNVDDPTNPTFEGATEYTASTPIMSNVTLFAKFQEIGYYKVMFNSNGGSEVATQEIDAGEKASEPAAPTKASDNNYSYSFAGWYKEAGLNNLYNFNDAVNENTTLFAKWYQSLRPAKEVVGMIETSSSLSYSNYEKHQDIVADALNREFTGVAAANTYSSWQEKTGASGIEYAGNSAGDHDSIQLRTNNSNSGIVVTDNTTNHVAKSITIQWNESTQADRTIQIYGKAAAYTAATNLYSNGTSGTLVTELSIDNATNNEISYDFTDSYAFIGIKSKSGAQYIDSIEIEWQRISYTYENLAIRFGGRIDADLWTRLDTESSIQGYGVLLSTYEYLNAQVDKDLKNYYASADGINVKKFTNADTYPDHELKAEPTLKDGYRVWNLYKQVRLEDATKDYVGVAFIQINGEVVFLNSLRTSVKILAQALIAGPERDENSLGGSLNYLANL